MPRNSTKEYDPILSGRHRSLEPPPTPKEMFRTLGLSFAAVLFMILVVVLLATILG